MPVECTNCKSRNPEGKRFCSDCGTALGAVAPLPDHILRDKVREIIGDLYRDQRLVELETIEAIANRSAAWAKTFSYFVGAPIAVGLFVLGLFGLKTSDDFTKFVASAKKEISEHVDASKELSKQAQQASDEVKDVRKQAMQFKDELGELSERVDRIDKAAAEKLAFDPNSTIGDDVQKKLRAALVGFQQYLRGLGYEPTNDVISIDFPEMLNELDSAQNKEEQVVQGRRQPEPVQFASDILPRAYYENQRIIIERKFARDVHLLLLAYMQYVINPTKRFSVTSDRIPAAVPVENGLAIYFVCSFAKQHFFASEAAAVLHKKAIDLEPIAKFNGNYYDSQVWANIFWGLRGNAKAFDAPEIIDRLLWASWSGSNAGDVSGPSGFGGAIVYQANKVDQTKQLDGKIRAMFGMRGIPLPPSPPSPPPPP